MSNEVKIYIDKELDDMFLVAGDKFILASISPSTAARYSYEKIQAAFWSHPLTYVYEEEGKGALSLEAKIAQGVVTEVSLEDL